MKIKVGSKKPIKINAVENAFSNSELDFPKK
jgi:non-canonical (house-cleaning) NTP pyrophosphatase